jgi:hypothetical protein
MNESFEAFSVSASIQALPAALDKGVAGFLPPLLFLWLGSPSPRLLTLPNLLHTNPSCTLLKGSSLPSEAYFLHAGIKLILLFCM